MDTGKNLHDVQTNNSLDTHTDIISTGKKTEQLTSAICNAATSATDMTIETVAGVKPQKYLNLTVQRQTRRAPLAYCNPLSVEEDNAAAAQVLSESSDIYPADFTPSSTVCDDIIDVVKSVMAKELVRVLLTQFETKTYCEKLRKQSS